MYNPEVQIPGNIKKWVDEYSSTYAFENGNEHQFDELKSRAEDACFAMFRFINPFVFVQWVKNEGFHHFGNGNWGVGYGHINRATSFDLFDAFKKAEEEELIKLK